MGARDTLVAARDEHAAGYAAADRVDAPPRAHAPPRAGHGAPAPAGHPQGSLDCFDLFVADTYAAMRGEARDGLPWFADGARSAHLIDAALASGAAGAWVEVP